MENDKINNNEYNYESNLNSNTQFSFNTQDFNINNNSRRLDKNFNKIIYPHVDNSKQRKSTKFIYCYYANVVDLRNVNDSGFTKFSNQLISFIMKSNFDKLIGPEEVYNSKTRNLRKQFTRADGELSCFWEFLYITKEQKDNIDRFLIETGYQGKLDRYAYFYEGCVNEDKIFLGGRKEMLKHYCKHFPNSEYCQMLFQKIERNDLDQRVFNLLDDPQKCDLILDGLVNYLSDENKKI